MAEHFHGSPGEMPSSSGGLPASTLAGEPGTRSRPLLSWRQARRSGALGGLPRAMPGLGCPVRSRSRPAAQAAIAAVECIYGRLTE
jgi:hypothetical protein